MQLLQRNKPTSLTCIHNIDYDMDWDSDEFLFKVNWDKKYFTLEIENKVKSSFVEFYALKQQIKKNEDILKANKLLFETENMKFQMVHDDKLYTVTFRHL